MREDIKQILEQAQNIALFGHRDPDGDCIGSMLGLGMLLEKQGKKVSYFAPGNLSKMFDFLPNIKKIKNSCDYNEYDLLVFLDFSLYQRIGAFIKDHESYFDQQHIIAIDHHKEQVTPHIQNSIKDENSISTCEILFEHTYQRWPKLFDTNIATYLYMGLTTDSGNFIYQKDNVRTFANATELLKLGARKGEIIERLFRNKSFESIQFMQLLLSRMIRKDNLLYTYYIEEEIKKYNIDKEEADMALRIMQEIGGLDVVVIFRKLDQQFRGSIRGKGKYDCAQIAGLFGGGGHHNASGFETEIEGSFEETMENVVKKITEAMK